MPRCNAIDHNLTRNYIPSISNEFDQPLKNTLALLKKRKFHEGRVIGNNFENLEVIRTKFREINFDCLLNINELIIPRFVLEFYSQLTFHYDSENHFVVNFVIQNLPFSFTLEQFGQILNLPYKGQASFLNTWSLDCLSKSCPKGGLYKTTPPRPHVIRNRVQIRRAGVVTRTYKKRELVVKTNEILTREIHEHMKPWVEIIRENVQCVGGNRDHVSACICHMLYCIDTSTPYNLTFFILKRMERSRHKPKELLPYGMLLTRLFNHIVSITPELDLSRFPLVDHVMTDLASHYERKSRSDHGLKR